MAIPRAKLLLPVALSLPLVGGAAALAAATSQHVPAATSAAASKTEPSIDPKAMEMLKQSVSKLRALDRFAVHAEATRDDVVHDGFKVERSMTEDLLVRKPDRLRAEVAGDEGRRLFLYDGKSLTLYVAPENYFASIPAGGNIRETLDQVTNRYDLELPLTDILYMAAGGDLAKYVTEAGVIGKSRVSGSECDQLGFRTKAVDWQIWIDRNDGLPRKLALTTRGEKSAPEYQAVLWWTTDPKFEDSVFTFTPPSGALRMNVRTLDEEAEATTSSDSTK
jgi:hypothetical protein